MKARLDMLRSQSNSAAVRVTAKTMENDEREERLRLNSAKVELARERVDRMRRCLLVQSTKLSEESKLDGGTSDNSKEGKCQPVIGGGLRDALVSGMQQIKRERFRFACMVFDMHRLDVGEPYSKQVKPKIGDGSKTKGRESAIGVGKIGGLPLPHAGPVLYGVIPPYVLAASLRLVASLTQLVARCLGVVLPHPILVSFRECACGTMYDFESDVIDVTNNVERVGKSERSFCSFCREGTSEGSASKGSQQAKSLPSSGQSQRRSSLLSLVGSSARKAIAITTSATSRAITQMHQPSISGDSVHSNNLPSKQSARNAHTMKPVSKESSVSTSCISRRIDIASFAYLRESYDQSATEYILNPPRWREEDKNKTEPHSGISNAYTKKAQMGQSRGTQAQTSPTREEFHIAEERFATGLMYMQNDVAALCFRAGVDVSALWPAESVLLNLHSLWCHCQKMAEETSD